jgi:ribose 5-phosphate isomerase A
MYMRDLEHLKKEAGIAACEYVSNGMKLGLGTGSTVKYTIMELGRRISDENLKIVGVPTSESTRILAQSLNIPLVKIEDVNKLDLTIDGADEFDIYYNLIKGGGGALTREKIVANASDAMIVVADDTKKVDILGKFPLPVEVYADDWESVQSEISKLCIGNVSLRGGKISPYVTDNDGYILDCNFGPSITNPSDLENIINSIDGVVDVGLFVGICDIIIISSSSGINTLINQNGRLS